MGKIRKWIHKHEKIRYVLKVLHQINNEEFVHVVNHMFEEETDGKVSIMRVMKYGKKNKGKLIYHIQYNTYTGFFAIFRNVLEQMHYADGYGMIPFVSWGDQSPYYEKDGVDGCTNVWEYYFEQVSGLTKDDVDQSYAVIPMKQWISVKEDVRNDGYIVDERYVKVLGSIVSKYIRIRKNVEEQMKHDIEQLFQGKKTLGVQIRMGSMLLAPDGHPIVPTLNEYISEIHRAMEEGSFEQIFLASDDKRAVAAIIEEFGTQVVCYNDVARVESCTEAMLQDNPREKHNFRCGLEVLRDVCTLAQADGLVAGYSQVSIGARIFKSSRNEKYAYQMILDKGINHNNLVLTGKNIKKNLREKKK